MLPDFDRWCKTQADATTGTLYFREEIQQKSPPTFPPLLGLAPRRPAFVACYLSRLHFKDETAARSANAGREPTSAPAASGRGQGFGDIAAQLRNTWKAVNKLKSKTTDKRE